MTTVTCLIRCGVPTGGTRSPRTPARRPHRCSSWPAGSVAARTALDYLPPGPLAIHFDVDVLDFTDAPLAENTDGRNTGPTLDQAIEALSLAARDPRVRALSIGELNPTRCAGIPAALPRFTSGIARVPAATVH